ncbi:gastrula zinc finger protein xLCGF3.1-like [Ruditapes philippinarum]|uniref:gastrula zinc finger protein xLCGF3.1-like n=1 Tax=Ruditapes philippinarum TaxID=129788 RepID=UPI00295B45B0|nr:gastrula zinc finger protein xLCGF3.1-like [Ruditapes philippinarum]
MFERSKNKLTLTFYMHQGQEKWKCTNAVKTILMFDLTQGTLVDSEATPTYISPNQSEDALDSYIDMNNSAVYVCSHGNCGKRFKTKYMISRHMKIHWKEKPFACRFCDYKCARKDYLRVHENLPVFPVLLTCYPHAIDKNITTSLAITPNVKPAEPKNVPIGTPNSYGYTCIRVDGLMVFICENCGKQFATKQKVEVHLLSHSKEKPICCQYCVFRTAYKSSLHSHMLIKHADRM